MFVQKTLAFYVDKIDGRVRFHQHVYLWLFMYTDTKSIKIQSSCQYLFMLLRSMKEKAGHKMLMKLTPEQGQPAVYDD